MGLGAGDGVSESECVILGPATWATAPKCGLTRCLHFIRDDATDEVWGCAPENSHQVVELLLRKGREGNTQRTTRRWLVTS